MLADIPRTEIDQMLFTVMATIYHFERRKVQLFGLNYEAFYLLYYLRRRSSARIGEIASELNVHISTASRVIGRLEKRGLLSRKKAPGDKRQILVSLEPEGEALVGASENHSFEVISKNLEHFSDEDIAAVLKTASCFHRVLHLPALDSKSEEKWKRDK